MYQQKFSTKMNIGRDKITPKILKCAFVSGYELRTKKKKWHEIIDTSTFFFTPQNIYP